MLPEASFYSGVVFWGVDLQACKTMTNTLVPVECAKWVVSAWNCIPLTRMMSLRGRPSVGNLAPHVFTLGGFSPPSPTTHPLVMLG